MPGVRRLITLLTFTLFKGVAYAQCAMCKATLETDMQSGGSAGKGINEGIIYLMFIPYLLIGTVGYLLYRQHKRNEQKELVE